MLELALPCKSIQRESEKDVSTVSLETTIALLIQPLKGTVRGYL
jgi:hypothetical protein